MGGQKVLFREVQKFNQGWLWILLAIAVFSVVVPFGYGMVTQLVFGYAWGSRAMSDAALLLTGSLLIVFVLGLCYLIYVLRLVTEVDDEGVSIHFYPLSRKFIRYSEISSCTARVYRPIREYGGWGIKYGPSGKAYNVSGDRGVQLVLNTGKHLLIGSQSSDQLAETINSKLAQSR